MNYIKILAKIIIVVWATMGGMELYYHGNKNTPELYYVLYMLSLFLCAVMVAIILIKK